MVECRSCLLRGLGPIPGLIYKATKGGDTERTQGDAQALYLLAVAQPCGDGYFSSPNFWGFVFYAIVRKQSKPCTFTTTISLAPLVQPAC